MDVVISPKDAIVPVLDIVMFFNEDVEFLVKESVEMPKYEGGWRLVGWLSGEKRRYLVNIILHDVHDAEFKPYAVAE